MNVINRLKLKVTKVNARKDKHIKVLLLFEKKKKRKYFIKIIRHTQFVNA